MVPDPTPPPVAVTPPTNLTAKWVDGADGSLGNIQVTWGVLRHSDGLVGYKITWGQPMWVATCYMYMCVEMTPLHLK